MAGLNDNAGATRSIRSASRLSPLQRAYLMGFRRARIYARRDVNASTDPFEAVSTELRAVRRELARLRAIDHALEAGRDDTSRLGESAQGSRPAASSTDLKSAALIAPWASRRLIVWGKSTSHSGGSDRSPAAVTSGVGVTTLQRFIWRVLNPPGRVARAIWIYFEVVSQLEALPDHDFRHMPISKRDAPAIARDDAMRSLAHGDVSWSFVGLAWAILLAALIGGAVAVLY